ncbi:MAG: hypothetical protein AB8H80_15335 [Planctomycetota bacterium]
MAGQFGEAGTLSADNVAVFDPIGQTWSPVAPGGVGCNGKVHAVEVLSNGNLVIGGEFTEVDGVPATGLALWDGVAWSELGPVAGKIRAIRELQSGGLLVGGEFGSIDGVPASNVAQWDGAAWSGMGSGVVGVPNFPIIAADGPGVYSVEELPSGQIFAVGSIAGNVREWDGSVWTHIPGGAITLARTTAVSPSGLLLVGGVVTGSGLLRWNGSSWIAVGNSPGDVQDVKVTPNGDIYTVATGLSGVYRRQNNGAWQTLAATSAFEGVYAIEPMNLGTSTRVYFGGRVSSANGVRVWGCLRTRMA